MADANSLTHSLADFLSTAKEGGPADMGHLDDSLGDGAGLQMTYLLVAVGCDGSFDVPGPDTVEARVVELVETFPGGREALRDIVRYY